MKAKGWVFLLFLAAALALGGCSLAGKGSSQALPTVVLDSASVTLQPANTASPRGGAASGVTASGVAAPAGQAQLAFALSEQVKSVEVAVGERVEAGQALASLAGSEKLAAAVAAANFELFSARQALAGLQDEDALAAARLAALQELNTARQAARDAEKRASSIGGVASQADIDIARSQLIFAQNTLDDAKEKFKRFESLPESNLARARYQVVLAEAQKKYDQALRKVNALEGTANDFDTQQAQADLEIAKEALALAEKRYEQAQAGPDPDLVAAAQARIQNGEAQLAAAQAALDNLELKAPFAGTVTRVNLHSGEWAVPGQPVLLLADLDHLRIETTDLSERDVPQVQVGQPVTVFIKALGQEVAGMVSQIAPLADTLGGDVVYQATIDLDSQPAGLRPGMSVEVQFGSGG